MHSCMVIFKRRCICFSLLVMRRGVWKSLQIETRQSMVWGNHGLRQSPRAWFEKFNTVVACYGLWQSSFSHSIFMRHSSVGTIILAVYIDIIVLTENDHQCIIQLKAYLNSHFYMKVLGLLRYFLGIDVARSLKSPSVSKKILLTCWKKLVH